MRGGRGVGGAAAAVGRGIAVVAARAVVGEKTKYDLVDGRGPSAAFVI